MPFIAATAVDGRIPGTGLGDPGVTAKILSRKKHHAQILSRQGDLALDVHHRIICLEGTDLPLYLLLRAQPIDHAHAPGLGRVEWLEYGTAERLNRPFRGVDIFGHTGLRHRHTGITQGNGAGQAVDQPQYVLCPAEDPYPRRFRDPQQFQPVQGIRVVSGADLLDDQCIQLAEILFLKPQAAACQIELNLVHVDHQAKTGRSFHRVGQGFCGPFTGNAHHTYSISQRRSPRQGYGMTLPSSGPSPAPARSDSGHAGTWPGPGSYPG